MSDTLYWAMLYAKKGFKVFPVYGVDNEKKCQCKNDQCNTIGKHPMTSNGYLAATIDEKIIYSWWDNPNYVSNIGIATGKKSGIIVLDIDPRNGGDDSLFDIEKEFGKLPHTIETITGGDGRHIFFQYPTDPQFIISSSNNFRPGVDIKADGGYVVVPPSKHRYGKTYEWEISCHIDDFELSPLPSWLFNLLSSKKKIEFLQPINSKIIEGQRNSYLCSLAGSLQRKGVSVQTLHAAIYTENQYRCSPALAEKEVESIIKSISKYKPEKEIKVHQLIRVDAFHGPLGEIVTKLAPFTEASKESILAQLIVSFGNLVGRNYFYEVESTKLFPNLFALIVGKSSFARKGTSWSQVHAILAKLATQNTQLQSWLTKKIKSGLSSGEGLIQELGAEDKRLLIVESEISALFKRMTRDGNTISQILREAWDGKDLAVMTRNNPLMINNPHISLIGHITEFELKSLMKSVDLFNGLANRFLWIYSTRSQIIPFAYEIPNNLYASEINKIKIYSQNKRIQLGTNAKQMWTDLYYSLAQESGNNLHDTILARGPAQILKLSLIYAIADGATEIEFVHLKAAKAMWDYSFYSFTRIFDDYSHNTKENSILEVMYQSPHPINRTQIRDHFNRKLSKEHIDEIRLNLENSGTIKVLNEGKKELWFLNKEGTYGN